jgi:hypothetical protein
LFYQAVVTGVDVSRGTYSVVYEDGTCDQGIRRSSMLYPSSQRVVFEDAEIKVVDGHVYLNGKVLAARFLAFASSPHLYQSATVLSSSSSSSSSSSGFGFDFTALVFDVNQALALVVPLYHGCFLESDSAVRDDGIDMCIVGAGAGCLAMCFRELDSSVSIDAIEVSSRVLDLSYEWFGVPREDGRLHLHNQDALLYFARNPRVLYDIVVVDVAQDHQEQQGEEEDEEVREEELIELPPKAFLSHDFLIERVARRYLKPRGWIVVNVIANRVALKRVLRDFLRWFPSVYICAVDPNYAFFLSFDETCVSPELVVKWACDQGYDLSTCCVLDQVRETREYLHKRTALGWMNAAEFASLLEDPSVLI